MHSGRPWKNKNMNHPVKPGIVLPTGQRDRRGSLAPPGTDRALRIPIGTPLPHITRHVGHCVRTDTIRGITTSGCGNPGPSSAVLQYSGTNSLPQGHSRPNGPRAAFSHSASVGRRTIYPSGKPASFETFIHSQKQAASPTRYSQPGDQVCPASRQPIHDSGWSLSQKKELGIRHQVAANPIILADHYLMLGLFIGPGHRFSGLLPIKKGPLGTRANSISKGDVIFTTFGVIDPLAEGKSGNHEPPVHFFHRLHFLVLGRDVGIPFFPGNE